MPLKKTLGLAECACGKLERAHGMRAHTALAASFVRAPPLYFLCAHAIKQEEHLHTRALDNQ